VLTVVDPNRRRPKSKTRSQVTIQWKAIMATRTAEMESLPQGIEVGSYGSHVAESYMTELYGDKIPMRQCGAAFDK